MSDIAAQRLRRLLPKDLVVDLEDRLRAEAFKAHQMVRDHAQLDARRARELTGQARFRMMEKGFEEVCALHGGALLEGGVIPRTELKVFQPFLRFGTPDQGVILGMAAMPEAGAVPVKNKSRLAGVSLNFTLTPRLPLGGSTTVAINDIFGLFLFSRDRIAAGKIEEVAVGVVDSAYQAFLFYQPMTEFLRAYTEQETTRAPEVAAPRPAISLKSDIKSFVPPESPTADDDAKAS
jgi:hypothetical protein